MENGAAQDTGADEETLPKIAPSVHVPTTAGVECFSARLRGGADASGYSLPVKNLCPKSSKITVLDCESEPDTTPSPKPLLTQTLHSTLNNLRSEFSTARASPIPSLYPLSPKTASRT